MVVVFEPLTITPVRHQCCLEPWTLLVAPLHTRDTFRDTGPPTVGAAAHRSPVLTSVVIALAILSCVFISLYDWRVNRSQNMCSVQGNAKVLIPV
jgi:hypothetical protein